jgi:hypothetical protein
MAGSLKDQPGVRTRIVDQVKGLAKKRIDRRKGYCLLISRQAIKQTGLDILNDVP